VKQSYSIQSKAENKGGGIGFVRREIFFFSGPEIDEDIDLVQHSDQVQNRFSKSNPKSTLTLPACIFCCGSFAARLCREEIEKSRPLVFLCAVVSAKDTHSTHSSSAGPRVVRNDKRVSLAA
jgi:hypothetical protein